jgi:hypothetical protein
MPSMAGSLLNRLLGPDPSEVSFARRGWEAPAKDKQDNLEKIGTIFLNGFACGMTGGDVAEIESGLEKIEAPFRGFAYEGCGMAMGVRDALRPFGQHWVRDYFAGRARNHIYMAHIGVGWAMARIPKARIRAIASPRDKLGWLALDGYGFHQAYFHTREYVHEHKQAVLPVWRPAAYANRVIDQGIGRALWFIHGSQPGKVARTIATFEPSRRGDLWMGSALASVYAGGAGAGELEDFRRLAGSLHLPDVAQAAVLAAKTRFRAGFVTAHTELGVKVYCDMSLDEALAVADETWNRLGSDTRSVPHILLWRQAIREHFE